MTGLIDQRVDRRSMMLGSGAGLFALTTAGCASLPGFSLTEAVRRLLLLASEDAFARLIQPDGFWDQQVARLGLGTLLGTRGDALGRVLTSTLFKDRLEDAFADIAIEGSRRAAPLVTEAVRTIGFANAAALIRGGPRAATQALRGEMGGRLIDAMVPELGEAIRVASDPLVAQLINAATGTDVGGIVQRLAGNVDEAIWDQIGLSESEIRANPEATGDPLLIGVFGVAAG